MYADGSVTKDQSGWGFTVKQGVTTIHEDSAACTVSTSSLTMEAEAVIRTLCWIASRGDSQTTHAIILTDSMNLLKKVEWEAQTGMCRWSTSTFENSCGCTALDAPCFSEDLKCSEAYDTTCGHKAKYIAPSIIWRREALKEEAKGRERFIVNQTNIGTFSKATVGKILRDGVERVGTFPSA